MPVPPPTPGVFMRSSRVTVVRLHPLVAERFLTVENANVHVWDIAEEHQTASYSSSSFATESQGTMHIGVAPLQCADWSPHNQDVFVCGGRERVLTLYDMRQRRPEAWRASPAHDGTVANNVTDLYLSGAEYRLVSGYDGAILAARRPLDCVRWRRRSRASLGSAPVNDIDRRS
jgi:WD40 repeat protein